ncbi:hypothetical protein M23134_05883 [Microscilla marina ATCC 23134]|uniref:Uncharacterized protein n=1 Tax=Microscilla marina ATCC 23134 TaxID=313606 RepID=A1ZWT6_MICM2|nr:hypothetical protein M23134_05883 [Microscilla marina ATCC 23134]
MFEGNPMDGQTRHSPKSFLPESERMQTLLILVFRRLKVKYKEYNTCFLVMGIVTQNSDKNKVYQ